MKGIKATLQNQTDIEIEVFADLHIGSKKCDYKLIQERIDRVIDNDNVYAMLLGDIINNSTKTSVGDVYSEPLSPMEQMKLAVKMFEPIKDKILCATAGNHERRSYKQDGMDLLWFLASELGIADKYDYCSCILFVTFGKKTITGGRGANGKAMSYSIYCTHGDGGGGRLVGSKANSLERRGQIVNADVIVTGHTHQAITFKETHYEVCYANSSITLKEQTFVNCGATLDYEEYAELNGLKPSSKANPVITLRNKKWGVTVRL